MSEHQILKKYKMGKTAESVLKSARENNEPVFVLRAKDKCAVITIVRYRDACISAGCSVEHIEGINKIYKDFRDFYINNPDKMKLPD